MSDTHVNAYIMELADAEKELTTVQSRVDSLKRTIASLQSETPTEVVKAPVEPVVAEKVVEEPKVVKPAPQPTPAPAVEPIVEPVVAEKVGA